MAKESMKAREVKRQKLVAKYAARKAELKKLAKSDDYDVAYEANRALQSFPKNASSVRLHNRCQLTGRPKVTSANLVFHVSNSVKWHRQV